MDLKWPLFGGSQFKLHFYSGWRKNRGSRQNFHVTSFLKDCWLIILRYEAFNRNKMHGNTNTTWNNTTKLRLKNTYPPGLFSRRSLFTKKIKLNGPLSRGSHFNIYFRLECWGNRGSYQNFHGIPFFKYSVLINTGHFQRWSKICLFLLFFGI